MSGYVQLQRIPYRGHHLLASAVLKHTRPGDHIFEGGVSSGYFAKLLVDAGRKVDGVEIDPVAAEEAKVICDRVIVGNLETLDLSLLRDQYDALLFGDTLEHLRDPLLLLRNIRGHLKRTGVVVVSVPNIANWAIRLSLLFGRFRYSDRGILDRGHLRFYTKNTLLEMLENAGFQVKELLVSVPVPGVSWPPLCRLAHVIGNLWPSFFGYQFIVTAVLKDGDGH